MRTLFLYLILTACGFLIQAQHFEIRHFAVGEGVPQSQVTALAQDQHGYLWLSTWEGIARYDGHRFEQFGTGDGLCSNTVHTMILDRDGNLWLGTDRGLSLIPAIYLRSPRQRIECYGISHGLPDEPVFSLALHPDGSLWMGTRTGIAVLDHSEFSQGIPDSVRIEQVRGSKMENQDILFLEINGEGEVYAADHLRLWKGNRDTFAIIPGEFPPDKMTINFLWLDQDGEPMISRQDQFYRSGTDPAYVFKPLKHWHPHCTCRDIHAFLIASDGSFWAAGVGCLARKKEGEWTYLTTEDGLPAYDFTSLLEDRDGNIWGGINGGGLVRIHPSSFGRWDRDSGLKDDFILSVTEGPPGTIWVGTPSGLFKREENNWEYIDLRKHRFSHLGVRYMVYSAIDERLYLSTGYEVAWTDGKRFQQLEHPPFMAPDADFGADALQLLPDGKLLIGTGHFLISYDGVNYSRLNIPVRSKFSTVRALSYRPGAPLLVGGRDLPMLYLRLDSAGTGFKGMAELPTPRELQGLECRTLIYGPQDRIWAGLLGGGVLVYNGQKARQIDSRDGLPSDMVYQLQFDSEGDLWIGTARGLCKLDVATYDREARVDLQMFPEDRSAKLECNSGASWLASDKSIWFGTVGGIVQYKSDKISGDTGSHEAERLVAQILVDGEILDREKGRSANTTDMVEIRFNLVIPEHDLGSPQYRYRLLGLDSTWSDWGDANSIHYYRMPSGEYQFQVEAGYGYPTKVVEEVEIPISVVGNGGDQLWRWAMGVFLLVFLLWGWFTVRKKRLHSRKISSHGDQLQVENEGDMDNGTISNELHEPGQKREGEQRDQQEAKIFLIKVASGMIRLDSKDILVIKGSRDHVEIHTGEKRHFVRATMKSINEKLPDPEKYLRVHRSWIVRLDKIDAIRDDRIEIGEFKVPIGKSYREKLRAAMEILR